ncbi:MAG: riboflavin synthase, partial [Microbacteriaceae bacterium]|nr:riboflavin synthase [Microbacteriaceae bacterium]
KIGDRIGGHIVQGHIDGTSQLLTVANGDAWRVLRFSLDAALAPLVTRKGSIAIDGVSLTVSAVGDDWFEVSLIPETLAATTLGERTPGDAVNIETDILARQVERLMQYDRSNA